MQRQSLAQDLGFAAGTQRQAARRLGRGNMPDDLGAAADQTVQVRVDGIDFLPQDVEIGSVH